MNNIEIEEFNPTKAALQEAVLRCEGLKIGGTQDEAGYEAVKVARKELGDMRIEIIRTNS